MDGWEKQVGSGAMGDEMRIKKKCNCQLELFMQAVCTDE